MITKHISHITKGDQSLMVHDSMCNCDKCCAARVRALISKGMSSFSVTQSYTPIEKCNHFRQEVKFGGYHILCSACRDVVSDTSGKLKPDMGVFMDGGWDKYLDPIHVTPGVKDYPLAKGYIPSIIISWPDRSVIDNNELKVLLDYMVKKIKGGTLFEIGCFGGHGRTGTLLGCLMARLTDIEPKGIIDWVRKNYCKEAIESWVQECAIYTTAGKIPPEKPKTKWEIDRENNVKEFLNMTIETRLMTLIEDEAMIDYKCATCGSDVPKGAVVFRDKGYDFKQCTECWDADLKKVPEDQRIHILDNRPKDKWFTNHKKKTESGEIELTDREMELYAAILGYPSYESMMKAERA